MKIKYEFLTGETLEVEVPDNIGKAAIAMDRDIYNSNRRETRRHKSIDTMAEEGIQIADSSSDFTSLIEERETKKALHNALDKLLPQQRELIRKVFFEGRTMADIAREEGVGKSAIQDRLNRIFKKLENFLI